MPAAIPIILQAGAQYAIAAFKLGSMAAALVMGGATLLGAYIASEMFGSSAQEQDQTSLRANFASTDRTIPIIYGTRLIGSNDVFAEVGTEGEGSNRGRWLWVVHCLCEGEIEGINQIDVDGVLQDEIYIDGDGIWKFSSRAVKYWVYNGDFTQTYNPEINLGTRKDKDDKFTNAMRGTAYIVFRFLYGSKRKTTSQDIPKNFQGVPAREVVVKGAKCYDLRTSTTIWTDNPAVILYDYMTNPRYGLGWDSSLLDSSSFEEGANYCDGGPLSDPNRVWSLNYVISTQVRSQTIIETILGHFRGALYQYNGKIYLKYLDLEFEVPVFSIENKHIARDSEGRAAVSVSQPSRFNRPEGAVVEYVNKNNNWVIDRINIGDPPVPTAQIKKIPFAGYTSRRLARKMGMYVLERERLSRTVSLTLRPDTVALDTNDLIEITSTELFLSDQLARVKSNSVSSTGLIQVTAVLESDTLYDKEYAADTTKIYGVDFAGISSEPPPVENIVITESIYSERDRSFVRLKCNFDTPPTYPWFSSVDVYTYTGTVQPSDEDDYIYQASVNDTFTIYPVEEGITYYFRFNVVSSHGVKQSHVGAAKSSHYVTGVSNVEIIGPSVLNVTVTLSSVDITANKLPDSDVSGYEVRLSDTVVSVPPRSWDGAMFIDFRSNPTFSYSGVKPGSHKIWLNTRHKNGIYGSVNPAAPYVSGAKYEVITLNDPPLGSHLYYNEVLDYTAGTLTNMTVSGSYPTQTMECAHTAGVRVGTFRSDEIELVDASVDQQNVVYVLFDFEFDQPPDDTWNALAAPPDTWVNFGATRTWDSILNDDKRAEAAKVDVSIEHSASTGGPYETVERLELLSAIVVGKYVRLNYRIEDPNDVSNIILGPSTFKAAYLEENLLIDL
jgi:hypothetical protein